MCWPLFQAFDVRQILYCPPRARPLAGQIQGHPMNSRAGEVLRVVCASLPLVQGSVMEELLAMRGEVSAFNASQGLRSAFLYSSGWVFQWHEGSTASVDKALRITQADPRHGRIRVLHRSLGRATLEQSLQIVTTHGGDKPTDVARRLFRLKQSEALEGPVRPDELWRELMAPRHAGGGATGESLLVQSHVVAVTSGSSAAVDLVRSIGQRLGVPMTYQRFATGDPRSADVGAVYVDVPGPLQVMRLHALSRRSLSHPMVRLLLRDLQCALLLLGDGADASCALAGDVGQLLHDLTLRPSLRLAAGASHLAEAARQSLQNLSSDIGDVDCGMLSRASPETLFASLLGRRHGATADCRID